jgi:hypothetical protein
MMESACSYINEEEALDIARRFLEQHYSISAIENIALEDNVWKVTLLVSCYGTQIREVEINAKTGNIIEWHETHVKTRLTV